MALRTVAPFRSQLKPFCVSSRLRLIWSIWFLWSIRLVLFDQTNKTDQRNLADQIDQKNEQDRLTNVFSILLVRMSPVDRGEEDGPHEAAARQCRDACLQ